MDLSKYRLPTTTNTTTPAPKMLPRHRAGEWFIKGPIPGRWLGAAAKLPGRSLHVAMAIWQEASLTKRPQVVLTSKTMGRFSVSRSTAHIGLKRLEAAGLVRVDRHNGRRPRVTICDIQET